MDLDDGEIIRHRESEWEFKEGGRERNFRDVCFDGGVIGACGYS